MHIEEKLLFEQSITGRCGVDLPKPTQTTLKLGQNPRKTIGLPSVSEPQVIRHFTRLSQQNFSIDTNMYPLGSCTMKHNPRLNEKIARLTGFANLHPLQPSSTTQGALELIWNLQQWLAKLTGLTGVSLVPSAGAHGEITGTMIIRKAHERQGNPRKIILIPDSAHGTNPATAALCGYEIKTVKSTCDGVVDMNAFEKALTPDVAAFMLTNPNTCGLFEPNIKKIADKLHAIGAYFYCDGANFNAIIGKVLPAELGIDVMQLNLHKTFATPHGGGGPGSGPVVVCKELTPYLPIPKVVKKGDNFELITNDKNSIGRIRTFHGQFGMMARALSFILSHGGDGLQKVAEDSVLNANYILSQLKDVYHAPYPTPCMHECLLTDKKQKSNGVTTHDIAKSLIDNGFHPMTVYFPLVINGAMLIEPTESEPKEEIDRFIEVMQKLGAKPQVDTKEMYSAPNTTPRGRLDEVLAARKPVLKASL